jgi:hypothetical protein
VHTFSLNRWYIIYLKEHHKFNKNTKGRDIVKNNNETTSVYLEKCRPVSPLAQFLYILKPLVPYMYYNCNWIFCCHIRDLKIRHGHLRYRETKSATKCLTVSHWKSFFLINGHCKRFLGDLWRYKKIWAYEPNSQNNF